MPGPVVVGRRRAAITQDARSSVLALRSRPVEPSVLGFACGTGVLDPVEIGVRQPDGSDAGAHLVTPAPLPSGSWPLVGMPSTCASARRPPCAAPRSSYASACRRPWPPSSCRAPAGGGTLPSIASIARWMATSWLLSERSSLRSASRIPRVDIVTCFLRRDPPLSRTNVVGCRPGIGGVARCLWLLSQQCLV